MPVSKEKERKKNLVLAVSSIRKIGLKCWLYQEKSLANITRKYRNKYTLFPSCRYSNNFVGEAERSKSFRNLICRYVVKNPRCSKNSKKAVAIQIGNEANNKLILMLLGE